MLAIEQDFRALLLAWDPLHAGTKIALDLSTFFASDASRRCTGSDSHAPKDQREASAG